MHYELNDINVTFRVLPLLQPNPDETPFNMEEVKKACSEGLSVCPAEDRAWAWLALLKVFPSVPNRWKDELTKMIDNYSEFVKDFKMENWHQKYVPKNAKFYDFEKDENIDDPNLMSAIHVDIVRTGRHLNYFPDNEKTMPGADEQNDHLYKKSETMRRIERILYIFGMINISIKYLQGFNELIMPLYFVMYSGKDAFGGSVDVVEAIVYHAFQNLITATPLQELYDVKDKAQVVLIKLNEFEKLFSKKLPNAFQILKSYNIIPLQYCYRWYNVLFAQEYEMLYLLIVWDAILAHQSDIIEYAYYLGISEILDVEETIRTGTSPDILRALQNLNPDRVLKVLEAAQGIWLGDKDKKEYKKWLSEKSKDEELKKKMKKIVLLS